MLFFKNLKSNARDSEGLMAKDFLFTKINQVRMSWFCEMCEHLFDSERFKDIAEFTVHSSSFGFYGLLQE